MYKGLSDVERRILEETYSGSEAMDNLTILCDDFGGRVAGSPENRAAAEFILGKFEEYGFEDPHMESFRFPGCEVGLSRLEIVEPLKKEIPCLTLPMTAPGEAEAELIYVEDGVKLDPGDLRGKIALGQTRLPFLRSPDSGAEGFVWMHPYRAMGPRRAASTVRFRRFR